MCSAAFPSVKAGIRSLSFTQLSIFTKSVVCFNILEKFPSLLNVAEAGWWFISWRRGQADMKIQPWKQQVWLGIQGADLTQCCLFLALLFGFGAHLTGLLTSQGHWAPPVYLFAFTLPAHGQLGQRGPAPVVEWEWDHHHRDKATEKKDVSRRTGILLSASSSADELNKTI